jgi:hypothetical protein
MKRPGWVDGRRNAGTPHAGLMLARPFSAPPGVLLPPQERHFANDSRFAHAYLTYESDLKLIAFSNFLCFPVACRPDLVRPWWSPALLLVLPHIICLTIICYLTACLLLSKSGTL